LVHTGSARLPLEARGREIRAGQVGLLRPGTTEYLEYAEACTTHHSWIALPPSYLEEDERAALDRVSDCLSLSSAMLQCSDAACAVATLDAAASHRPVLVALARAALALYVAEARQVAMMRASMHPAIAQARSIARHRACDGLEVQDLAREVGLSPEHLVRLFHREVGVTPGAFLRAERLSRAMYLLEHTGLSVAEIAYRCGFARSQHLARCLQQATGMTATQLRAHWWTAPAGAEG
jgi:AraC family transcriptional regulator of arabinose operon